MATLPRTVLPAANAPSRVIRNHVPNSFASLIARHTRERGARSTTRFSIRSVLIVVLQPVHDAVLFLTAERRDARGCQKGCRPHTSRRDSPRPPNREGDRT